jgi:hypothetical protein
MHQVCKILIYTAKPLTQEQCDEAFTVIKINEIRIQQYRNCDQTEPIWIMVPFLC